ncbi:hypothetical protein GCM10022419_111930 [Nonomuraea rosea]|uniref:Uncharacterized protein n=2 Tax=Nonomuraea rosea TaxID=638574 RepID=A0ABP6ZIH3_9ACTN
MSPLGEFTRQVAGELADSGCPPEWIDGPADADRVDAELAAAAGDMSDACRSGLTMTEAALEASTETVEDVSYPVVPGGYKTRVTFRSSRCRR